MPELDILCLANARKHLGRCVAGLRMDGGGWIRLVSKSLDGTLNWSQYLLDTGKDARVLDVIRAGVTRPRASIHQPENWVIDGRVWKLAPAYSSNIIAAMLQKAIIAGPEIFGGPRDRVAIQELEEKHASASLALVAPERIDLVAIKRSDGKLQTRGRFALTVGAKTCEYDLSLTDPHWEAIVKAEGPRVFKQTEQRFVATISLGEPFNGYCYKLLAAIIVLPPELTSVLAK